jgi:hypothetical protein
MGVHCAALTQLSIILEDARPSLPANSASDLSSSVRVAFLNQSIFDHVPAHVIDDQVHPRIVAAF